MGSRNETCFGRLIRIAAVVAGVSASSLAVSARSSAQQSPFSTKPNPSSSGAFTLPVPGRPGESSSRSGVPSPGAASGGAPLRPAPGAGPILAPGSSLPAPLPPPEGGDLLPLPPPSPAGPRRVAELPPKPRIAPPLSAEPTGPISDLQPVVLKAGLKVTMRIAQVIPADGLTAGERLLNSRPAIQKGDRFLAEVIEPCPPQPTLVGGVVTSIAGPGFFGRPGYVGLQMTQLVRTNADNTEVLPWSMDMADRRFSTKMRRVLLSTLLGLEGAGTGGSVGAQYTGGNMAFIGGGMAIGAVLGTAYASLQRGVEAYLEAGDTFEIVVGTTDYQPVSREWQTILYPAGEAEKKRSHK